jgi:hypothetical protein
MPCTIFSFSYLFAFVLLSVVFATRSPRGEGVRCLGRLPTYFGLEFLVVVLASLYWHYIYPEMSRSAQNQCLDYYAPFFSSPNHLSSLSLATSTSKASRYQG